MAESAMDSSDCTGVEPQSSLNRCEDVEERTQRKTKYLISRMQKSVQTNMKEEEDGECQSLKMMREDESYEEGYRKEEEKQTNEQMGGNATCPDAHTDELVQNTVKSEQGQQEENDFSLVRLLKQPEVPIAPRENGGSSVPVSSPPRSMVTPLRGNGLLRLKKDQVLTQKSKTVGQLERPMELLPFSSEIRMCAEVSLSSPVVSSQDQNPGQTVEETSQVFASSQCPFVHTEEVNLHQDIEKVHTEQLSRTLGSQKLPSSSCQHPVPPKTLPTPTQSHTGTPGAHTCSQCGKSYTTPVNLKIHQRTHTGERPYLCSHCGRSFIQSVTLTAHLRTHTGERPYSCSQCGKTFANKSNLQLHQRTHLGVRLHLCSQCGKSYATALNLKMHQRTHTGERPYTCSLCGKSFAQWNCFKMHQRTHTGERPYPCSHCGKSFAKLYNLKVHQRIHTGERPYSCSHCGQSFSQLNSLNVHLRNHTGKRS